MTTASTERGLDPATLAALRESLRAARRDAFQTFGVTEEELRCIEEDRQSELEERAQDEAGSEVLSCLEVHEYRRLRQIQAALDRISDGTYGRCVTCGGEIARERLLAIPEALLCADCATTAEGNWARKRRPWRTASPSRTSSPRPRKAASIRRRVGRWPRASEHERTASRPRVGMGGLTGPGWR